MRSRCSVIGSRRDDPGWQRIVAIFFPQRPFGELAGRGMRKLVDEHDVVGNPPLRSLPAIEIEQRLASQLTALFAHDEQQGPLIPFRMPNADDGGLDNGRMANRDVLEL